MRTLAESWGVTYRRAQKAVWFRLEGQEAESGARVLPDMGLRREMGGAEGRVPSPLHSLGGTAAGQADSMGPSFLAEASELLAGQLDEDMVAALAGQLLVPRFAMSVTGLARHLVRLLAREGHDVALVLGRLNAALTDGSLLAASGSELAQARFLSLLYGELKPDPDAGGAHCTIASAGHPLPLRLSANGSVAPVADPQILIGIDENAQFHADSFDLAPGETLLCVTDGVTERRNGDRQLDDDDGLAAVLRGCTGLGAKAVAERVRSAVRDFGPEPVGDDLTVLVLEAASLPGAHRVRPQG
ncbi:MAG TPA: PP2C family protein-serine/threonine phosphatase [Streptosporangiaceae bacterium]|nr:PP2C family protein-serine/threonine phosphatase [Streptosporangiaceae bacterium]